nr:N-acetylglucosamine-1-phosphodiester alpha-N-acetylglucosaminidase isoform X2 [Doryrhamphus excisus]
MTDDGHQQSLDCKRFVHGHGIHESWPSNNQSRLPVVESKVFASRLKKQFVSGHFTVVRDPLRTVSVLEPGGPGGCGTHKMATVEETARAAGCLYAQNAGYFNTKTGHCLGNIVSDGRMVMDSGGVQNAQFGIRRDGTLVFGYLSKEDVLDLSNPFVQLISGVVWLIRNGKVNIKPSLKAECGKTQETGTLQQFTDVISARTAVGHDAQGRLILFHLDGKTSERGMSLWQMADFLKDKGVINAINLDGGGSSTFIANGSLASYPSDECSKPEKSWRCARPVSTILCVHPHRCQPPDCSGHGQCVAGLCQCQEGWRGAACNFSTCQSSCGAHGVCAASGCVCDAGWRGQNCSQECPSGFYGDGCKQTCSCMNNTSCHHIFGNCSCPPGFYGAACEKYGRILVEPLLTLGVNTSDPTQSRWLTITVILSVLLLLSLVAHVLPVCQRWLETRRCRDYDYLPLTTGGGVSLQCSTLIGESGKGFMDNSHITELA